MAHDSRVDLKQGCYRVGTSSGPQLSGYEPGTRSPEIISSGPTSDPIVTNPVGDLSRVLIIVFAAELVLISLFAYEFDSFFQYAAAYRLLQGKTMYLDFAYQQMPLLPFVYAGFFSVTGVSLFWGRMLGVLFGILTVLMSLKVIETLNREAGEGARGSSRESLLWVHIAFFSPACYLVLYDTKTYLVSLLMVFLLYSLITDRSPMQSCVAGVVAAALGLIKLTYLPIGAIYLLVKVMFGQYRWPQILTWLATWFVSIGAVMGYYYWVSPDQFYYLTVKGHIAVKQIGFDTSKWLFGYLSLYSLAYSSLAIVGGYLSIPFLVILIGKDRVQWEGAEPDAWRSLWVFGVFALGTWMLIASTIIPGRGNGPHYFAPYMPVVMLFAAIVMDRSNQLVFVKSLPFLGLVGVFLIIILVNLNLVHNLGSSMPRPTHLARIISQYKVAEVINRSVPFNAVGLGYPRYPQSILTAGRDFIDGNETTINWFEVQLSYEQAKQYHILTKPRWRDLLTGEIPDFLVVDNDDTAGMLERLGIDGRTLIDFGYVRIYADMFTGVYVHARLRNGR